MDEGFWEPSGNADEGLREGMLKFNLKGSRLKGKWALVRLKPKPGETKNNWLLLKEKDEYANSGGELSAFETSVRTGRTMAEIEKGEDEKIARNPFNKADIQLAKLVSQIPGDGDWLYELKYDGYRIVRIKRETRSVLLTRNGHDYTSRFSEIAFSLMSWAQGRAMVLDGEMVITDEKGKSDFQALQSYLKKPGNGMLTYIVFDLLALDGKDIRGESLIRRKELLEALMKDAPNNLHFSGYVREAERNASLPPAARAWKESSVKKPAPFTAEPETGTG